MRHFLTAKEKRELIKKLIANGDKRSYNEIAVDLELQIWTERFHPNPTGQIFQRKERHHAQ